MENQIIFGIEKAKEYLVAIADKRIPDEGIAINLEATIKQLQRGEI